MELPTLVYSTHEEAWRWRNVRRKTDWDDALKLARLAAVGQLKPTHVPTARMREYRSLIKYRKQLVGRENSIKNSVRSIFANRGIPISRGKRTWYTGRVFVDSHRKPLAKCSMEELWRGELDQQLVQLDQVGELLSVVEKKRSGFSTPVHILLGCWIHKNGFSRK